MIFLVDFKYNEQQTELKTSKFSSISSIIDFVAEQSVSHASFEIVRINEYKNGALIPYELTFVKGRIDLVRIVKEGE